MRRSWRLAACWIGAAAVAAAAQPQIAREGGWWVRTISGSEPVHGAAQLRIAGRGDVKINGDAGGQIAWVLKARVRAGTEAEARARLQQVVVRPAVEGGSVVLTVQAGRVESGMTVTAPRSLREVTVATPDGRIEVYDVAGAVTAVTGGGAFAADRVYGGITARTGGGEITLGDIGGAARCATGGGRISVRRVNGDAVLETGGGDIDAGEVTGNVRAATTAGTVRVARAGGTVIASTGGGPIEVGEARGIVELRNAGGPVRVGAASGVRCESAAGAIQLRNVSGSLRASTAIGSILAQLIAGRVAGDSFLTTGGGDITVLIPSNVGVKILAENELSGGHRRIVSEFPGIHMRVQGAQLVAEGDINGGGPLLRISGTGGIIFIKRQ
jgi:DUF4097 and DUF4098 domain-containing protein YvlB